MLPRKNGDIKTYTLDVTREAKTADNTSQSGSGTNSAGTSKPTSGPQTGAGSWSTNSNKSMSMNNGSTGSWSQGSQQGTAAVQKPSTATLSALSVSAGTWNKTFSKDTYTYHIAVTSDVNEVTITDTTAYSGATVTVNGDTSRTIQLGSQKKTIVPIVVTKDSDQKTYVLVFDKDVPQTTTTVAAAATSAADTQTADIQTTQSNTKSNSTENQQAALDTRKNSASVTWWSRLINSIRSFFSNL
jgi:hypothetical protein